MGSRITHCGGEGCGSAAKVCGILSVGVLCTVFRTVHHRVYGVYTRHGVHTLYPIHHHSSYTPCIPVTKVCNNLVLGISMAAVSEGLALGQALGLEPKLLSDVFNTSSARCWSSDTYNPCPVRVPSTCNNYSSCPHASCVHLHPCTSIHIHIQNTYQGVMQGVPSSRNYQNGFGASLMVKDLQLAHQASALVGTPIPMTTAAAALYQQVAQTHPSLDFSAVFQVVYTGGEKASYGSEKASEKEL